MSRKTHCCNGCKNVLPRDKPRIHCQICPEYNSCAECHVIESFSGLHSASHDYEIFLDGNRILTKEGKTVTKLLEKKRRASTRSFKTATDLPGEASTAEQYWGSVVMEDKSLCPVFIRLLAAIFNHFDQTVYPLFTGWMEPSKFRAVWSNAGYSIQDIPLLNYAVHLFPSGYDIYEYDRTLALVYRALSVDHTMATWDSPPNSFQESFADPLKYVPNGMPLLTRRGFEQYVLFHILVDPTETLLRLNHLLALLPPLIDSDTKQPFNYRHIPRSCFPALLDPSAEELRRSVEKQRRTLQAWRDTREADNAWKQPIPGEDLYNKMTPGDFMYMRWASNFQGGY